MTTRTRRLAASILLVGAFMGIAVAPAAADVQVGGAVTRSRSFTLDNGQSGGGELACPTGYRVISAGVAWRQGGAPSTPVGRSISGSAPRKDGRAWFVAGSNDNVRGALRLTIRCLPVAELGPLTIVKRDATPVGSVGDGYVACPVGHQLITGGAMWMTSGLPRVPSIGAGQLGGSAPVDARTWIANGYGAGLLLRVIGLCRPATFVGTTGIRFNEVAATALVPTVSIQCAAGKRALSGGTFWKTSAGSIIATNPLGISRPTIGARGWYASGWKVGFGSPTLVVVVFCRRI